LTIVEMDKQAVEETPLFEIDSRAEVEETLTDG
jgi:hypothetical protein